MVRRFVRAWIFALCAVFGWAGAAAAAVPATPIFLTNPPANNTDWMSEVLATPGGFLVTWTRSRSSPAGSAVFAQQFNLAGKPAKPAVAIRAFAGNVGGRPEVVSLGGTRVALFWLQGTDLNGTVFDLATNKVVSTRRIGTFGDLIHDVVRLSNGQVALVMVVFDGSNPFNLREKVSLTLLSPTLSVVKGPLSVHGAGFPADGWNMFDQTIVDKQTGGIVFFRDRVGGQLFARKFTNAGTLSGAAFRINTTPMQLGPLSEQIRFNVKAARLTNGRIVVAWVSLEAAGADGTQVRARMLDAAGTPVGGDFRVHTVNAGAQFSPEIVPLPNGLFAVLWSTEVNFVNRSHHIRAFNSQGAALGAQQTSETGTMFDLSSETEAARLSDGSLVNVLEGFVGASRMKADGIPNPAP
jgi:hypothetical protein